MKTTVKIPHVRWNEGQPRFDPGPHLRPMGYASRNLKHPDGRWFTFEEANAESHRISEEALQRKAARAAGKRLLRPRAPNETRTLGELCEACFDLPAFQSQEVREGRKLRKGLSPKTVSGYRKCRAAVEQACDRLEATAKAQGRRVPSIWDIPAASLSPVMLQNVIDEVERKAGLHMARAVRAFLSQMWTRLGAKEPGALPEMFARLETLPTPEGRVRPWTIAEFTHMLHTADAMGRPEIGDAIVLGALTSLRQNDRLALTREADVGSHIIVKTSKTGKTVTLLKLPLLTARLAAAQKRRARHQVNWPHLVIDETAQTPWAAEGDHYRKIFAQVRANAAETMPSCATVRDQDLRDTAQTWMDRAGAARDAIAAAAGHAPGSAATVQARHYIEESTEKSDGAITALGAWLEGKLKPAPRKSSGCSASTPPLPLRERACPGRDPGSARRRRDG